MYLCGSPLYITLKALAKTLFVQLMSLKRFIAILYSTTIKKEMFFVFFNKEMV